MKSREPAVRPDIAANDLGPIEQHLQALATARRLPRTALLMCIARYEEAAPTLRAVLERAADGALLSEDERMLLFHGVHIQGTVRDELACPALLRLLRRPEPELDRLLGLALTESLSRILCGVFDGDVDALLALIADRKVDEFVRHAVFGAAAFLTWDGRIPAERMHGFLQRFDADRLAGKADHTWIGWLETIALLGLRDLAPLVHRAWDDGRVNTEYLARQDFETELREAESAPRDVARFRRSRLGYVEDVLGMLEWTERAELEDDTLAAWSALPPAPVTNPWRNVGRNDPCPCGSGKKAKHCHLAQ